MTIRHISASTATTTDAVVKVWKKQTFGPHPGLDTPLPKEQAEHLLTVMAQPTTRRTPEAAQAAAQLLAEFRAGMHQNGHVETRKEYAPVANPGVKMVVPDPHFKPGAEFKNPAQHRTRTAKRPDAQPITPESVKRRFRWPQIGILDVVYLSTIATAVYGLWFTLREMGAAFAVPYCLISWHALRMAKNPASRSTAQVGIAAVVVLEILTFFVHLVLFNLRTVQAAKAGVLPFEYSFYGSLEMPFVIACILAGLFSAAGIYAVSVTFLGTSEKHALAEKAKRDAEQSAAHVTELRAALEDAAKQWAIASGQNHFDTEKAGTLAERYYAILKQTAANGG
jgi:hypothetical protein